MAIDPSAEYPAQIDTSDPTGYPLGQPRNITTSGDGTGTPLEKKWLADLWGFLQALLAEVNLTSGITGVPDKVGASDYLLALKTLFNGEFFYKFYTFWIDGGAPKKSTLSTTSQDAKMRGAAFSYDGTKAYFIGENNKRIYQYNLTKAWDLATATYSGNSHDVSSQASAPTGVDFKTDGTSMYVVDSGSDTVYQYTLSIAWDVSSATYSGNSWSVTSQDTNPGDVKFGSSGTKMFVLGRQNKNVYAYDLSTAWSLASGVTYTGSFPVGAQATNPQGLYFKVTGTQCWVTDDTGEAIYQYGLGTAWVTGTAHYQNVWTSMPMWPTGTIGGIHFSYTGARMYVSWWAGTNSGVDEFLTSRVAYSAPA